MTADASAETSRVAVAANAPLVLVIEDDRDAATVAQGMLNLLGYRSRVAPDVHEALHLLSSERPALILLDICLPTMDGVALLKIARKLPGVADIPVVAASAVYGEEGPVAKLLAQDGVNSFLDKPFSVSGLRGAIERALAGRLHQGRRSSEGTGFVLPGREDTGAIHAIDRVGPPGASDSRGVGVAGRAARTEGAMEGAPIVSTPGTPRIPPSAETAAAPAAGPRSAAGAPLPPAAAPPSPVVRPATAPPSRPDPASTDSLRRVERSVVREAQGVGRTASGDTIAVVVERCAPGSARLRLPAHLAPQEEVRVQVAFRVPVNDAMTDLQVRMLARIDRIEQSPAGDWIAESTLLGVGPNDAFLRLIEVLRDW